MSYTRGVRAAIPPQFLCVSRTGRSDPSDPSDGPRLIARSSPLLVPAKHPESHTVPSGSGHRGPAAAYYTDQRRRSEEEWWPVWQ